MDVRIEPATAADLAAIVAVIRAAFAEYDGRLDPPSSAHAQTPANVARELADGGALVARIGDSVVGCVFHHWRGDHVYLDRLAVLPAHRGAGIGRALLAAAEQRARARGLGEARLTVRLALAGLRASYERLGYGFLEHRTHAGYGQPTAVTLRKPLGAPGG